MSVLDENTTDGKELNNLQAEYGALERRRSALRKRTEPMLAEIKNLGSQIQSVGTKISKLKHGKNQIPHITDHAVVRYLQRVKGINMDDIKHEIAEHPKAVLNENVIITILGDNPEDQTT